jgi:hypothetical protein
MELAKLLEHNAQASALTPRRQLRVVGSAPMRTLCVLIRLLRILREEVIRQHLLAQYVGFNRPSSMASTTA